MEINKVNWACPEVDKYKDREREKAWKLRQEQALANAKKRAEKKAPADVAAGKG